jgi:tetratricopeptide (TPR) repeat protein
MSEILSKKFEKDPSSRNRAIYYVKTYLKYAPKDIETKYILSFMLYYAGKLNESKEILSEIIAKNPNHQNSLDWLGEIYFLTNKTEALKFFRYLYDNKKIQDLSYAYHLYAILEGRYYFAKEFFEKYLQKNKNRLSTYIALIEIYKSENNQEKLTSFLGEASHLSFSYKDYHRAIELTKQRIQNLQRMNAKKLEIAKEYEFIAKCHEELGNVHLSLVYLRKAIQKITNPEESLALKYQEAVLLRSHKIKRYKEALKILSEIEKRKPKESNIYFEIGLTYFLSGNYPQSIRYYNRAISLEANKAYFYYYRANSYEKLGYVPEVQKDIQKCWEINPNFSQAYNFLGYLYAERNIELEESLKLIKKAIELEPDNPAFQDSLGWIYYQRGNLEEALYHLQLAVELMEEKDEKDGVVYEHLGDIFYKLKDFQMARDYWQKALTTESSELNVEKVKQKLESLEKK